jgi:hypothetical protein
MNPEIFVAEFINEFTSYPECYDDVVDLLDATLDDIVSNNSIEENKVIITDYAGDVFVAINLYNHHLGNVAELYSDMSVFYEQLAYISLFVKLYPMIENEIENEHEIEPVKSVNFQSFVKDFTAAVELTNIQPMDLVDKIVSCNTVDTNKTIIFSFSKDISQSIQLYKEYVSNDINELYYWIQKDISIYYRKLAMAVIYDNIQQYAIV